MRILGIHINRDGIKIPFTEIRVPIQLAIRMLIPIFGIPVGASSPACRRPSGDYEGSCSPNELAPYYSSDPNVPAGCVLQTDCNTMFSGLPRVHNEIYFAPHEFITNVKNNNGTLTYNKDEDPLPNASRNPSGHAKQEPCVSVPLQGSFERTCRVESQSTYDSTDPKLKTTSLCKAEISCEKIEGGRQRGLTVWYDRSRGGAPVPETVENCDGKLKVGIFDNECSGRSHSDIGDIGRRHGKTTLKI